MQEGLVVRKVRRWRDFKLKVGILSIGRLPIDGNRLTWHAALEYIHKPQSLGWTNDVTANGDTIKELFRELRLHILLEKNPKAKKTYERMNRNRKHIIGH